MKDCQRRKRSWVELESEPEIEIDLGKNDEHSPRSHVESQLDPGARCPLLPPSRRARPLQKKMHEAALVSANTDRNSTSGPAFRASRLRAVLWPSRGLGTQRLGLELGSESVTGRSR